MDRGNKKAMWLIAYVSDMAASNILREEILKLAGYEVNYESEENAFIWIGIIKSIILHFRLKKFGIISMFNYVKLTDSIWA